MSHKYKYYFEVSKHNHIVTNMCVHEKKRETEREGEREGELDRWREGERERKIRETRDRR